MKTIIKSSLMIVLLSTIFFSGCIFKGGNESYHELYYSIQIEFNGNAQVYLPIPYDYPNEGDLEADYSSKLIDDLEIETGNGQFELISTDKGLALMLNFTNEVTLIAKRRFADIYEEEYNDYHFDGLSLKNNNSGGNYYFHSNQDNVKIINFICYFDRVGSRDSDMDEWKIENNILLHGWSSLELN